jgi:hypothetical protein
MKFKAAIFILLIITIPVLLSAQLNHFIYLQTEGKQPFYAKIDKKVFSSSASGYVIIPKLKDGGYNVTIGFPKGEIGEQIFLCTVNSKDAGYLVKKFGDKGWGLFNMQTLDVVMAGSSNSETAKTTAKADEFSSLLSEVVNDPSIKQPEKPITEAKEIKTSPKQEEKPAAVVASTKSVIIKSKQITTDIGVEAVYIDITDGKQDTVTVLIPVEPEDRKEENKPSTAGSNDTQKNAEEKMTSLNPDLDKAQNEKKEETETRETGNDKKDTVMEEKKFLPVEMKAQPHVDSSAVKTDIAMVNSDCKAYASEEDFLKLRKKMASEGTEEEMMAVAQKFLKSKCYSTDQIKNLSVLFLNEEGKYKFFDAAYPFVSDSSNFHILENQLKDTYYISRFKAMIRH